MKGRLWMAPLGAPEPPFLPCEGWVLLGEVRNAQLQTVEVSGDEGLPLRQSSC